MTTETTPSISVTPPPASQPAEPRTRFVGSATGQSMEADPPAAPASTLPAGAASDDAAPAVLGKGGQPMPPEAISERIARARKTLLRELFDTDDEAEARQLVERAKAASAMTPEQRQEYERLRRQEEARKRARLTREQRVQSDLQERDRTIASLQQELQQARESSVVNQQDQRVSELAGEHIDPNYLRYAKRDLAEHLTALKRDKPKVFAKFGEAQIKEWFGEYAKQRPAFAKQSAPPPTTSSSAGATPPVAPVVRRTATTTRTPARAPAAAPVAVGPGTANGKTVRPGQPNSMSKAEVREFYKSRGMRYPG